jgi:hypothetical protein
VQQDVLRLDVTVDHIPGMRMAKGGGDLPGDGERVLVFDVVGEVHGRHAAVAELVLDAVAISESGR